MRLIDADKLIESMNDRYNEKVNNIPDNLAEGFMQMEKLINEQPTAFDVDKVVEQLEELSHFGWIEVRKEEVFEIVKLGGRGRINECINCPMASYSQGRPYCIIEKRHLDSFSYQPDWCSFKAGGIDV